MQAPLLPTFVAPAAPAASSGSSYIYTILGIVVVGAILYGVYKYYQSKGSWTPTGVTSFTTTNFDGKTLNTISGADIPKGVQDYGVQFWMYIRDWDYNFGKKKVVLRRKDPSAPGVYGPEVHLSPNENTLNVTIALFPSDGTAQKSTPAPANQSGSATGDSFTCSVENVPLQSWFSVSVTVFQRNVDIYLDGKLVKSCVLPGVPRPVAGDIEIGADGGFSGTVCDVYSYAKMLSPDDAAAFHAADTACRNLTQKGSEELTGTFFGYTAKFGLFDTKGKRVKEYVF